MRRVTRTSLAARSVILAMGAFAVVPAAAQSESRGFTFSGIGGRAGIVQPEDGDTQPVVLFHMEFMRPGSRWHISPEVRYWSDDPLSDLNLNVNAFYHFAATGGPSPYVGLGAGVHFYSFDSDAIDGETDPSLNVLGGFRFPVGSAAYVFAEARYAITDLNQLDVLGGFTVPLAE